MLPANLSKSNIYRGIKHSILKNDPEMDLAIVAAVKKAYMEAAGQCREERTPDDIVIKSVSNVKPSVYDIRIEFTGGKNKGKTILFRYHFSDDLSVESCGLPPEPHTSRLRQFPALSCPSEDRSWTLD
jgi:hypothetical protein